MRISGMEQPDFDSITESNPDPVSRADRTRTTNEAGGEAYAPVTPELGLVKLVINNLIEEQYYDSAEESYTKLFNRFDRMADENPEFVLQLAVYARHEAGLRDVAQLLLVLAANDERVVKPDDSESSLIRDYTPAIIDRTDEFNSVLSYQLRAFGKPVPNGLSKGIEDALHKKYVMIEVADRDGTVLGTERETYIEYDTDRHIQESWQPGTPTTHDSEDLAHIRAIDAVTNSDDFSGSTRVVDQGYVHDEYTFTKYQQRDKSVSLHDVLNLVRPNARSDNRDELFGRIAKGELDSHPDVEPLREDRTWEATRSDETDDRSEAEQWRDRIDDMGVMARIRNLRNMLDAGLTGREIFDYDGGSDRIFGPESERIVRNSKQFPFRYYQAYKACSDSGITRSRHSNTHTKMFDLGGDVIDQTSHSWLARAIDVSVDNVPDSFDNMFTAIDLSGSMDSTISGSSEMARAEIGALFGAILLQRGSEAGVFGSDFARVRTDSGNMSVLKVAQRIYGVSDNVGNSTNGHLAIEYLTENDLSYDSIVIFTDEQLWDSTSWHSTNTLKDAWDSYQATVNPNADLFVVDLASYGDLSMPEGYRNVHQISGWGENVIEFIDAQSTADDLIRTIGAIEPDAY